MEEFNPYAPPKAPPLPSAAGEPPGFMAYRLANGLYGGLMGLSLVILLGSGTLRAEFSHALVVSIFLAPLLCFYLVVTRRAAQFRRWLWVQTLGTGALLLLCLLDIAEGGGLRGIGVFMTAVNAAALLLGQHFLRLRQPPDGQRGAP